jgi:hypothetical protein
MRGKRPELFKNRLQARQAQPHDHVPGTFAARQDRRARYFGVRKNVFDLRRAAVIQNLETIHRTKTAA